MHEGRIVKALSGFYYVMTERKKIYQCKGRGVFRKHKLTPLVGDYVVFQKVNEREGYILKVMGRKNMLVRPPISNVDQAILVFSAVEPDFSPSLLDRFLVLIEFNQIKPVICITKVDLLKPEKWDDIKKYAADYENAGYPVLLTSAKTGEGVEQVRDYLKGKISVFAGQSGVGKSSLLNALRPDLKLKTADISASLGRGKHTTRHVELIEIDGGLVADTPGFSSLEFHELEAEDLGDCFPEMARLSHQCKFRGCLHMEEPQCAVKEAVESNEIPSYRYEHYQLFMQEIKNRKPRY